MAHSTQHSPRLSIGMPVYNAERYLAEALDCFLAQTFQDFDIIVSDNASTDRTAEICRSFAERDPRIRYYRNEETWARFPISTEFSSSPDRPCSSGRPMTICIIHAICRRACVSWMTIQTSSWPTPRRRSWTIAASLSLSIQRRRLHRSPNRRCPNGRQPNGSRQPGRYLAFLAGSIARSLGHTHVRSYAP